MTNTLFFNSSFIILHSSFPLRHFKMYAHAWRDGIKQTRQAIAKCVAVIAHRCKLSLTARHGLTHLCVCVALVCAWSTPTNVVKLKPNRAPFVAINDAALDAMLQSAANDALGAREGAIIVLDPQTGRVRAVVTPRLAGEQAFPPGSAIKPFTLLTALRSGALDPNARLLCRKHYVRLDAHFTC